MHTGTKVSKISFVDRSSLTKELGEYTCSMRELNNSIFDSLNNILTPNQQLNVYKLYEENDFSYVYFPPFWLQTSWITKKSLLLPYLSFQTRKTISNQTRTFVCSLLSWLLEFSQTICQHHKDNDTYILRHHKHPQHLVVVLSF